MLFRFLAGLMVFFVLNFSLGQESNARLKYRFGITKFDFFTGMEYSYKFHKIYPYGGIELGVNRTFFQKRPFPKILLGSAFDLIKSEKIIFGPNLHYACALLKVNSSTGHIHQFHEAMSGFKFEYGTKWIFSLSSEVGWIGERAYDQIDQRYRITNSWGYLGSIGLVYAW